MNINRRQRAIKKLEQAFQLLADAASIIHLENSVIGEQFDYVNAPDLSTACDKILNIANNIDKMVYQKNK